MMAKNTTLWLLLAAAAGAVYLFMKGGSNSGPSVPTSNKNATGVLPINTIISMLPANATFDGYGTDLGGNTYALFSDPFNFYEVNPTTGAILVVNAAAYNTVAAHPVTL